MSRVKKNVIKIESEIGTESEATIIAQTLSPSKFKVRKETTSKPKSPRVEHMPYRSAGGASTGSFALRRTQHHYLPPPIPTMSSHEINIRLKKNMYRRKYSDPTLDTINKENNDGSASVKSIGIDSEDRSIASKVLGETDIGEDKKQGSELCGGGDDGYKETSLPKKDEKRLSTICTEKGQQVNISLENDNDGSSVALSSTDDIEDGIITKKTLILDIVTDSDRPDLNAPTEVSEAQENDSHKVERFCLLQGTKSSKQSSGLHGGDESKDKSLLENNDSNHSPIDEPIGVATDIESTTIFEKTDKRCLNNACTEEMLSNEYDVSGVGSENSIVTKVPSSISSEGGVSNDINTPDSNTSFGTSETHGININLPIEKTHGLKVMLDDVGNTSENNGRLADLTRSRLSRSDLVDDNMGHKLIESAATNISMSLIPYGSRENDTLDEERCPNIASASSHSTTEKANDQCSLGDELDEHQVLNIISDGHDGDLTASSIPKILQTTPKMNLISNQSENESDSHQLLTAETSAGLDIVEIDTNVVKKRSELQNTSSNQIKFLSEKKEGGLSTTALEFGNAGATKSPWQKTDASSDSSQNEIDHWGSIHSIGGVSSITGQSSITNSESTLSSIQSPTLHHLKYLAGKSSSALYPSFTPLTTGPGKEDVIIRELLLPSQSQQKSNNLLNVLFNCKSREDAVSLAVNQARCLNEASTALLHVLIEYVHKYCGVPFEQDSTSKSPRHITVPVKEKQKGLVLSATAIGWLSLQLGSGSDKEEQSHEEYFKLLSFPIGMKDKLSHLKLLLAKCTNHLRITGAQWPPTGKNDTNTRRGNTRLSGRKGTKLFKRKKSKVTPTDFEFRSAVSFLLYYRRLQVQPRVDIALFSNIRSLELDGLAPDFLINLHRSKETLLTMKVKRGCIFNMPRLFNYADTPIEFSQLKSKHISSSLPIGSTSDVSHLVPILQHLTLSHCGIGELACLKGERSNLKIRKNDAQLKKQIDCAVKGTTFTSKTSPNLESTRIEDLCPPLSLMTNLVTLDMSNNELIHSSTALAGLVALPKLSSINLSDNYLMSMKNSFLMLGNIKCLILSGNRLSNVDGLDRMYSLERLDLDKNRICRICDMASLARLPQLMQLCVKGNPVEKEDPVRLRILLLNIFRESRHVFLDKNATYRDVMRSLPKVDGVDITRKELVALRDLTFTHSIPKKINSTEDMKNNIIIPKDVKINSDSSFSNAVMNHTRRQLAPFKDEINYDKKCSLLSTTYALASIDTVSKRQQRVVRNAPRRIVKIVDTDSRRKLHKKQKRQGCVEKDQHLKLKGGVRVKWTRSNSSNLHSGYNGALSPPPFTLEKVIQSIYPDLKLSVDRPDKNIIVEAEAANISDDITNSLKCETSSHCSDLCQEEQRVKEVSDTIKDTLMTPNATTLEVTPGTIVVGSDEPSESSDQILATSQLTKCTKSTEESNDGSSSTGDTSNKSSGTKVPILCNEIDVESAQKEKGGESISSKEKLTSTGIGGVVGIGASALGIACLGPVVGITAGSYLGYKAAQSASQRAAITNNAEQNANSVETNIAVAEEGKDSSKTSESSFKDAMKRFDSAAAERKAKYDGPATHADLFVVNYYEQYFQTYVFPASLQEDSVSLYSKLDHVHESNLPRIQLYQTDRDLMMLTIAQRQKRASDHFFDQQAGGEKFVAVSQEDVLPCGIAATSRIAPNEKPLRGFHGDTVLEKGAITNMVDSQRVMVCISNSAVYFMPCGSSKSTAPITGPVRSFPSSVGNSAKFRDAYWLHAYCRHPLKFLRRITIGFGLQRLTMHFQLPHLRDDIYIQPESNDMMSTFHYTYVIFTCNKYRTNDLLKSLQSAAKLDSPGEEVEVSHDNFCIDNDDRIILETIFAMAPNFSGVIRHYQILYQMWRQGDRDPIRRALILTDDQILLFNENYIGDNAALTLQYDSSGDESTGNAALQLIHSAELNNVLEICAADEDPRLITLVIKAPSRLRRSHHWRLMCRDGENAERVIEDVRKATAACQILA